MDILVSPDPKDLEDYLGLTDKMVVVDLRESQEVLVMAVILVTLECKDTKVILDKLETRENLVIGDCREILVLLDQLALKDLMEGLVCLEQLVNLEVLDKMEHQGLEDSMENLDWM